MTTSVSPSIGVAGATLAQLVAKGASHAELAAHLDALDPSARIAEVRQMGRAEQSKLWELAKGKSTLELDAFVGAQEQTVIYEGKNVLPVFSFFQKRFYRRASGVVVGYNHNDGFTTFFAGPGYFSVSGAADGEILFDYTRLPDFQPPGWPAIAPNSGIIPGAVYGGMLDYIRSVGRTTVIGAAFKGGKPRNQYFMLTRAA